MQVESKKYRKLFILRELKIPILGSKLVSLNCCGVFRFVGGIFFPFSFFFF